MQVRRREGPYAGLITSTQPGWKDRFIRKNTVCLVLESVKIYPLVYSHFFCGFTGKSPLFCRGDCKEYFDSMTISQWLWKEMESEGNYKFMWSIIDRAA